MLPPPDSVALPEHDPTKPPLERPRLPQLSQVPIRLDERLLRCILGELKIAQERIRVPDRHVLEPPNDLTARLQIPAPRPLNNRLQLFHLNAPLPIESLL